MHSVKRVRTSKEAQDARRRREAVKIKDYRALASTVAVARDRLDYSPDALELTRKLLAQNPEHYTAWNYRREILTRGIFQDLPTDDVQQTIDGELLFVFERLREFPKCYWLWNHRTWCLRSSPTPRWGQELKLVTKMLEMDARNFHGWQYRRYVVDNIQQTTGKSLVGAEFDYTTQKINANFSNFSAWHNRSKLIPTLLAESAGIDPRELLTKELALITQAIYTDPDDQSVWLYHRWLVTSDGIYAVPIDERVAMLRKEIASIAELYEVEPDSKWCIFSLAFYKELLADLTTAPPPPDVADHVHQLLELDPMRARHYQAWLRKLEAKTA
ncbi:uncharacterized protein V1510DRAFT_413071 [Dipodascopsis tothii]|uniref:uncharacterized protein n=1 Tax=Dipodascopsis tothii TaxID=44089 RepID=UPI0034CFFBBF